MPMLPPSRDFSALVRDITARYGSDEIERITRISRETLERWRRGSNHFTPKDEWALYHFCLYHQAFDLVTPVLPSYDRQGHFSFDAPPLGYDIELPRIPLLNRPTTLAGYQINFPFGISASVLTRNSKTIAFYSARGFDILTYKTVRGVARQPHPAPNWVFIDPQATSTIAPPFDQIVVGDPSFIPDDPRRAAMANSFGVPSQEPDSWMQDVEKSKRSLRPGQVLIVSVVATPPVGDTSEQTLIDDFVNVATRAKEAGADIVEANYSCPNTFGERAGDLYHDPESSGKVSAAIKAEIGTTPLFVKIGYLGKSELVEFFRYNQESVRGIVAINTIPMRVVSPAGSELFPDRAQAGISGEAIRKWSMDVVRNLVAIREQERKEGEVAIVAVGGVSTPQDIYDYLDLGADAVESCTAAYLNPRLALEARQDIYYHASGISTFQPSCDQVRATRARLLLELYDTGAQLPLDRLAERFSDGLRPSDVAVAEQFGAVIRGLQDDHLIERDLGGTMPTYKLTAEGYERVRRVRSASTTDEHNSHL